MVSLVVALVATPPVAPAGADEDVDRPSLRLSEQGSGVRAVDVPVPRGSAPIETTSFSMVGLTWREGSVEPDLRVRTRADGVWSRWQQLDALGDGPDRTAHERSLRITGTDLVWVGRSDAVRIDVGGARPSGLTLVLLDPTTAVPPAADPAQRARRGRLNPWTRRPPMQRRVDWGAERSLRTGSPSYNHTIKQVHIHHTVNSNRYSRGDVRGLLRGMYWYHTQSLGWSDIGYNFLVDRFGRTWVGRAGGAQRAVQGAHTLGFNSTSTGIAVIGNYETRKVGRKVIAAIVRLAAWKLNRHDRNPRGRITVRSRGSDRFPAGRRVTLPTIDGHRDTNETACPGARLYLRLPVIRQRTAARMARW